MKIQLGENCETRDSGGEILDIRKGITVRYNGSILMAVISARAPSAILLLNHMKRRTPGKLERRIIPFFSMVENSACAEANFSGSRLQGLAKTGGAGLVRMWLQTLCCGCATGSLSEYTTSENSCNKSWMALGVDKRLARRGKFL